MNIFEKMKKAAKRVVMPTLAAAALSLGSIGLANKVCIANYVTIKNPDSVQEQYINMLDGFETVEKMVEERGFPDTVSINLEGDKAYGSIEDLMNKKYIVAYGWNNGEPVNMYSSNGNITLLNPNAQTLKVVKGVIDKKEEAEAIADLLNYCGTESKTPYDEITNKIEELITQYQQQTQEQINDLKLVIEQNGKLQLEINRRITYELNDLEKRVTILEERTQKPESDFSFIIDITGLYGNNSSAQSDSSSGLGYKVGGEAEFDIGNFVFNGGINYLSHKLNSKEQKGNTSTTTLEGTLGYKFGPFGILAGIFHDSIKQKVEANDYIVSVEGNAFGPIIKLDYENDSIGVEAYLGKSLTGQTHQNVIILGNAVNSNGILDVLKAGGKVALPVYENGSFKGNVVVGLDYKSMKSTYNDAFGDHNVSETNVSVGLRLKF